MPRWARRWRPAAVGRAPAARVPLRSPRPGHGGLRCRRSSRRAFAVAGHAQRRIRRRGARCRLPAARRRRLRRFHGVRRGGRSRGRQRDRALQARRLQAGRHGGRGRPAGRRHQYPQADGGRLAGTQHGRRRLPGPPRRSRRSARGAGDGARCRRRSAPGGGWSPSPRRARHRGRTTGGTGQGRGGRHRSPERRVAAGSRLVGRAGQRHAGRHRAGGRGVAAAGRPPRRAARLRPRLHPPGHATPGRRPGARARHHRRPRHAGRSGPRAIGLVDRPSARSRSAARGRSRAFRKTPTHETDVIRRVRRAGPARDVRPVCKDRGRPADPVSAFLKIAEHSDYAFLLEASRAASTSAATRSSARIRS